MRKLIPILAFLMLAMPFPLVAQLDQFAIVSGEQPDFGAVPGTWGHLQFYRPYGMKGVVLEDWRDLMSISPISGELINTDRHGWIPVNGASSLWQQTHPKLTSVADTTAPSLLVNYRQGFGEFKDFTLWYHNSLGENTRYGWTSKLRSHPRALGITMYDEQRHRIQTETLLERSLIRVEGGYDHGLNPLYMYQIDTTTLVWNYADSLQLLSDRWEGNVHWQPRDSSAAGSEFFALVQGGIWEWPAAEGRSLSSLVYWGQRFKFRDFAPGIVKFGMMSKQLGDYKTSRPLLEIRLPRLTYKDLTAYLGVKLLDKQPVMPLIDFNYSRGPLRLAYETHQLVDERLWEPSISTSSVHHISSELIFSGMDFVAGAWQSERNSTQVSGNHSHMDFHFPWEMDFQVGFSQVNDPVDWVFSEQQLNWELNQNIHLFKNALHSHLKVWGRHLVNTSPGFLSSETLMAQSTNLEGESKLHLLNYTISAEVSTLIFSFTDMNVLQDPLWSQNVDVPWAWEYSIMTNQITDSRFRYLSIIWVFDN